jgi:hypothetical protein
MRGMNFALTGGSHCAQASTCERVALSLESTQANYRGQYRGCALFFAFLCLFLAGAYCHSATHIVVTWTPC